MARCTDGGVFPIIWCPVLLGVMAGSCQVLVLSPVDAVKIQMQTRDADAADNAGLDDDVKGEHVSLARLREEAGGLGELYRAVDVCLLRICLPLYAILLNHGADAFATSAISGIASSRRSKL